MQRQRRVGFDSFRSFGGSGSRVGETDFGRRALIDLQAGKPRWLDRFVRAELFVSTDVPDTDLDRCTIRPRARRACYCR